MINNKQKAILHIAKAQLGLSEVEYREILKSHGGAESSVHLSDFGFDKVMRFFEKLGFKKKKGARRFDRLTAGGAPLPEYASEGQRKVIYHLMEDLGWWPARLYGFIRKMTGKENPEELSGKAAQRVIEGMKAMRDRKVNWN